jgi:hypothetical protein
MLHKARYKALSICVGPRKDSFGAFHSSSVERGGKVIGGPDVADQQAYSQKVSRMAGREV